MLGGGVPEWGPRLLRRGWWPASADLWSAHTRGPEELGHRSLGRGAARPGRYLMQMCKRAGSGEVENLGNQLLLETNAAAWAKGCCRVTGRNRKQPERGWPLLPTPLPPLQPSRLPLMGPAGKEEMFAEPSPPQHKAAWSDHNSHGPITDIRCQLLSRSEIC